MNILIAPDSFKGSLSAAEFCNIANRVLQKYSDSVTTSLMPLADGGEGTIEAVQACLKTRKILIKVHNAIGIHTTVSYAFIDKDQSDTPYGKATAIIEMAQACGLPDIPTPKRNPMKTSSFGLGELIKHALDTGAQHLIIGLGGSAINDGGTGMLSALGVQFFSKDGQSIIPAGAMLEQIDKIDTAHLDPRLKDCTITIASDVTNPLLGEQGATRVFAPQKGADVQMVEALEKGMLTYAYKTIQTLGLSDELYNTPGSGAAGGLGFALLAYLNAEIQSGFELLAKLSGLDKLLANADTRPDMIITGEGYFDQQSLGGKLTGSLIKRAEQYHIPVKIICGDYSRGIEQNLNSSIQLISLKDEGILLEQAIANSTQLLEQKLSELIRLIHAG